ncbi:MAG: hypothetical protein E7324_05260 [Clostridiales bacterium]|nr:hypothetical protein [Clostridiales bacterium]
MFEQDREALAFGALAVENCFLMDYLPAAKGDYVKVYLWGLFMSRQAREDNYSLEEMAQDLFLSLSETEAALRYWERRGLVSRIAQTPARYIFHSPLQRKLAPGQEMQADGEYVSFAESVYAMFDDRRKVTPAEIALAWEWVQDVGLRPEVVLMLLAHCISQRGVQFSFKKAEPLAIRMKEEQVVTCDDADAFLHHEQSVHDGARKVLSRMGKRRNPSEDELALYEKWTAEWGFLPDAVLDACRETTKGDPSFKYLDGILAGIRDRSGARTGAQVKRHLDQEQDEKDKAYEIMHLMNLNLHPTVAVNYYRQCLQIQPHEIIVLAARECARNPKRQPNAEDLMSLLEAWKARGLANPEQVQQYLHQYREANLALKEIFECCGHSGRPTPADRALYEKWKAMGMDRELMLFAAEQARAAEGSRIAYLDKVLQMWHEAGITDISQASARRRPQSPARQPQGKTVTAQRYGQREYTEEELLAVSEDLMEEAKKQRG